MPNKFKAGSLSQLEELNKQQEELLKKAFIKWDKAQPIDPSSADANTGSGVNWDKIGNVAGKVGQFVSDAFPAAIALLNQLIPDNTPSRVPEVPYAYDPNAWGTGSTALMRDGGKLPINYEPQLRRGGKIKVTYDNPEDDPANYKPFIGPKPMDISLPVPVIKEEPKKGVSFEKLVTKDGREVFSPVFDPGFSPTQVRNTLNYLPSNFQGIPVVKNYNELQEYWLNSNLETGKWRRPNAAKLGNIQVEDNAIKPLSESTFEFGGNLHKNGGTQISYGGNRAEVEKGETAFIDSQDNLRVMGNLKVPGTSTKFKDAFKTIAKEEEKVNRLKHKANKLITDKATFNGELQNNSAAALLDAALQKDINLSTQKEMLANIQDMLNIVSNKKVKKMKDGGKIPPTTIAGSNEQHALIATLRDIARRNNVDPDIFERMIAQESAFNPKAKSKAGAAGIAQFMPNTAKQFGLDPKKLITDDPAEIEKQLDAAAKYLRQLQDQFGDPELAVMAYNRGPGNISKDIKKVKGSKGKESQVTAQDLIAYYDTLPDSSWKKEVLTHYNKIFGEEPTQTTPVVDPSQSRTPDLVQSISMPRMQPLDLSERATPDMGEGRPVPIQPELLNAPKNNKLKNRLTPFDFMTELAAIADTPDTVQAQYVQPQLLQPYQVSFQDRINRNNAVFRAIQQQTANNPAALGAIAGEIARLNNEVEAEQFRVNQAINNAITNQNTQLLNQAQLTNLQLADQQYVRQQQAKSITEDRKLKALASIANKVNQNKQTNRTYDLMEQMFGFGMRNGNIEYTGGPASFGGTGNLANRITETTDPYGNVRRTQQYQPYRNELEQVKYLKEVFRNLNI